MMKTWVQIFTAVLIGLLAAGLLFLVTGPPRGEGLVLSPAPTITPLIVHVSGAVYNPGVYTLELGSRVKDAIDMAGGFLDSAFIYNLNMAQNLSDGDKVAVSFISDPDQPALNPEAFQEQQIEIVFPINLNTATQIELEALPVIGPAKAEDILTYRETHGEFTSIEQIQNVYGIGPSTFEQLKDLIIVED
ncbi:MAG: hypothetical protein HN672_09850 [Chloroflexi bacterium]|nr:hypothetical protein [Chloroflexota bacterium]